MTPEGARASRDFSVFTWLNLVCLDAPLVAVSWQWLFAQSFEIPVARGGTAALFLTAWLIYLADRFGDSLSVNERGPLSLRQRFCRRHRSAWIGSVIGIALVDLVVIAQLDGVTMRAGARVGVCAVLYLVLNQRWPSLWRRLPLKEISIGFLFAAGTRVGLAAGLTGSALPGWFLFACLCALNCVSIAVWERELDRAQGRISIATIFPNLERYLLLVLFALTASALGFPGNGTQAVAVWIAGSALLLAGLHFFRNDIAPDVRTALADLVLLTPVAALIARALFAG